MATITNPSLASALIPLTTDNLSDTVTITVDRIDLQSVTGSTPFTVEFTNIPANQPTYSQLDGTLFGAFCIDVYLTMTNTTSNYTTDVIYATEIDNITDTYGRYFSRYKELVDEFTFLFNESNIDANGATIDIDLNNDNVIDGNDVTGLTSRDVQNILWYWVQQNTTFSGRSTYGSRTLDDSQVVTLANQLSGIADNFNSGDGYLQTQRDNSQSSFGNEVTGYKIPVFLMNQPQNGVASQPLITYIEFAPTTPPPAPEDPGIALEKTVVSTSSGTDPETGLPIYNVDDTVTFQYVVTNTSTVELKDVVVFDDNATPLDPSDDLEFTWDGTTAYINGVASSNLTVVESVDTNGILDAFENWTFQYTTTADFKEGLEKVCETDPCDFVVFDAFSGSDIQVTVTLTEIDGGVQVDVAVSDPSRIGDIRGVFFDVKNNNVGAISDIVGDDLNSTNPFLIKANDVDRIENDVLMRGGGTAAFDVGVQVGTQGISKDDIQSTSFDVEGLTIDDLLGQRFAIRLTSVGTEGGSRNDSSKIVGSAPTECDTTCTQIQTNFAGVSSVNAREYFDGLTDVAVGGTNVIDSVSSPNIDFNSIYSQSILVMG